MNFNTITVDCPLHGKWVFTNTPAGHAGLESFKAMHGSCKWPVSIRRFPPKSCKRVLA